MNNNNGNGHDKPRAIRRSLDLKKRQAVFRRDGCKCVFCGKGPQQVILHVDHKKPWIICVKEGLDPDGMDNLQTVCEACNQGKLNYWDDSLDLPIFKLPIDDNQLSLFHLNGYSDQKIISDPNIQAEKEEMIKRRKEGKPPEWPWAIEYPDGRSLLAQTLVGAEQLRLELQYWSKHGHPAGIGSFCMLPDDIHFLDNRDAANLRDLIDDSHKKYDLLPKWPIRPAQDTFSIQ